MSLLKCKQCGAPGSSAAHKFTCEYCGTLNVDEEFFKSIARDVESTTSDRLYQVGLAHYIAGDAVEAEKSLTACVTQSVPFPADAWIYLALCKVHQLKPSNFDKSLALTLQYIERASQSDVHSENVDVSKVLLGNEFLESAARATDYFFSTAKKKYIAYGENREAAQSAFDEAARGIKAVKDVFILRPTDASLRLSVAAMMLDVLLQLEDMGVAKPETRPFKDFFVDVARATAGENSDMFTTWLAGRPKEIQKIFRKLAVTQDATASGASALPIASPAATGLVHKLKKPKVWVPATLVLLVLVALGSGSSKKANSDVSQAAPKEDVSAAVPSSNPASSKPAEVANTAAPQASAPTETVGNADPGASGSEKEQRPQAVGAADNDSSSAPAAVKPVSFQTGADGTASNFVVKAPASAAALLTQMIGASAMATQVADLRSQIEALPKPTKGDRKLSRSTNDLGLKALQAGNITDATATLRTAVLADPSDVEVRNNLAFALYKANDLDGAETELGTVLSEAPGRTSAWANLADIYARKGLSEQTTACFVLAFQFSSNRDKTLTYLRGIVDGDDDAAAKAAATKAIAIVSAQ
jgi:hypothetical protein